MDLARSGVQAVTGRFLDTYLGTGYPAKGVAPRPAAEVRDALLAPNDGALPFVVRPGVKDPLRNTVLAAGWTWRGVLFRP
ncbi:hypothetical protein [Streptomyces sp. NPDC048349]|uniref:hypothetical protein n=1 Tax=Streptomyces sp. NPDC048349 TaxID=3155486 RepID=UPI00341F1ACF